MPPPPLHQGAARPRIHLRGPGGGRLGTRHGGKAMTATEQRPEGGPAEAEPVPITRYPNRRLYDRSQGRYVTLPEIADLVRRGKTVAVRDSKTGEDLTRSILMQIILEHHPERMALFPVTVLNSMIGANEAALAVLENYFRQSLASLEVLQRSAAVNPFLAPMDWMRAFFPNPPPPNNTATSPPAGDNEAATLAARVAELERRIEELQATLGQSRPPAASRARTSRRNGRDPKAVPEAPRASRRAAARPGPSGPSARSRCGATCSSRRRCRP